jgi:phosphoribosylamine--glycine ligase
LVDDVRARVVRPVIDGFQLDGEPYTGFLYVSMMLTPSGPMVIEFNVRFGDPEAQVVLPLIEGNFAGLLMASATGSLSGQVAATSSDKTVGVVVASRGYPASAENGQKILGLEDAASLPGVTVIHAGTKVDGGSVVTAGGRVLTVVGRGPTFDDAMATAYRGVDAIKFDGMQYRRDIGKKASNNREAVKE